MKLPAKLRQITRTAIGLRKSASISPAELQAAAAREDVLVLAVGMVSNGALDERLPGEQRGASLTNLAEICAGVPRDRLIVAHCG